MNFEILILCIFVGAISANVIPKSHHDGLKTLVRRQVDEEEPATVSAIATGPPPTPANEACTPDQCNHKGTCFGTKAMPFCFCQLGYAGASCQDRYCDSARDCNGRGWCMGTAMQYTCLCNLGFSGTRCELQTVSSSAVMSTPAPFGVTTGSAQQQHVAEDPERIGDAGDEQI